MDCVGQRRHIRHPGYPLMYVKFYRLFAETDLNGSVSLRPQQQIPLRVPLDAHGRCLFLRRPFILAHATIRPGSGPAFVHDLSLGRLDQQRVVLS